MPFGADNALIKAAEIVRRLAEYRPTPNLDEIWGAQVASMNVSDEVREGLMDPAAIWSTLESMPPPVARTCHACTHTTFSPNVANGGLKTNIVPDTIDVEVDIRTVPGTTQEDVMQHLREALGDLFEHVEVSDLQNSAPTASSFGEGNPLWRTVAKHTQVAYPGAKLVPGLIVGGTDARFYRERGRTADVASLGLSGNYFHGIARELLG